jgi:hypothetical protein
LTIQVGIRAIGGSIVLVSDTKVRTSERVLSTKVPVEAVVHQRKFVFASQHGIAVAMAGQGEIGKDPARELALYLSSKDSLEDHIGPLLEQWGNAYFQKHSHSCSLIVVRPETEFNRFYRLRVGSPSSETGSNKSMVNGEENSPAVLWLEWLKADDPDVAITLDDATGIAITTVLMARDLNPYGIGGLEIHQYNKGQWGSWTPQQCESAVAAYRNRAEDIRAAVLSLGLPVVPAPT